MLQIEERKEGANLFKIRDDAEMAIVPEGQHRKEQQLKMKLPMGILKSGGHSSDNNLDLEYVFQSERNTNEKKKVDFEIEGSEFTQSVYDS